MEMYVEMSSITVEMVRDRDLRGWIARRTDQILIPRCHTTSVVKRNSLPPSYNIILRSVAPLTFELLRMMHDSIAKYHFFAL